MWVFMDQDSCLTMDLSRKPSPPMLLEVVTIYPIQAQMRAPNGRVCVWGGVIEME